MNGLTYNDVKMSFVGYTDSVNQMQDGHAVAFGLGTQIPAGAVMDLAAARDIKLIDQARQLDEDAQAQSRLHAGHHPEGHLSEAGQDVKVIGYATHIVVSCKLPADEVYTMTKTIAANTKTLATVAKDIATLHDGEMAEDIGVPFHPGAAKFYKEAGITVQTH